MSIKSRSSPEVHKAANFIHNMVENMIIQRVLSSDNMHQQHTNDVCNHFQQPQQQNLQQSKSL